MLHIQMEWYLPQLSLLASACVTTLLPSNNSTKEKMFQVSKARLWRTLNLIEAGR